MLKELAILCRLTVRTPHIITSLPVRNSLFPHRLCKAIVAYIHAVSSVNHVGGAEAPLALRTEMLRVVCLVTGSCGGALFA